MECIIIAVSMFPRLEQRKDVCDQNDRKDRSCSVDHFGGVYTGYNYGYKGLLI